MGTQQTERPAIHRLTTVIAESTDTPVALVYLVVGGALMVLACLGVDPIMPGDMLALDDSLSGEVVRTGLPLIISDVSTDPALAGRDLVRSHDIKTYAGFPIRNDDDGLVIAVLAVAAHQPRNWTTRQLRCLDDVSQLLADVLSCGVHTTQPTRADG